MHDGDAIVAPLLLCGDHPVEHIIEDTLRIVRAWPGRLEFHALGAGNVRKPWKGK